MNQTRQPSSKKRFMIMVLLMVLLGGGLVGFNLFKRAMMQKYLSSAAHPPQTVTVMTLHRTPWQPSFETIGALRALQGANLTVEVAGTVRQVRFHSGDWVKEGQILVEMVDDAEKAALAVQEAGLGLARLTLKRDQAQADIHAISQAQLEGDEADVRSREAQCNQARALLAKKMISAPFSGRMGVTTLSPGQYLNPGDKIASLQTVDRLRVDFNLPQQYLSKLEHGQQVLLTFDAWPGKRVTARVLAYNSEIDATTRNLAVEAKLDASPLSLLPGSFAHVTWSYDKAKPQLTLPQAAIAFNPYGATVFVVHHDTVGQPPTVQQAFITTGETRGDQVVVLDGLKEGDEVVTSGHLKLKSGMTIAIRTDGTPPDDPHPTPQEH